VNVYRRNRGFTPFVADCSIKRIYIISLNVLYVEQME